MKRYGIVEKVVESIIYVCNACHEESWEETAYDASLEQNSLGEQTGNVIVSLYSRCAKCKEFFHDNETKIVSDLEYRLMEDQRISEELHKQKVVAY